MELECKGLRVINTDNQSEKSVKNVFKEMKISRFTALTYFETAKLN